MNVIKRMLIVKNSNMLKNLETFLESLFLELFCTYLLLDISYILTKRFYTVAFIHCSFRKLGSSQVAFSRKLERCCKNSFVSNIIWNPIQSIALKIRKCFEGFDTVIKKTIYMQANKKVLLVSRFIFLKQKRFICLFFPSKFHLCHYLVGTALLLVPFFPLMW